MIYQSSETMTLTRNCLALATSSAVTQLGLLLSKITYPNGNFSVIDLATGQVTYISRYRKQPTHNRVNDNIKAYKVLPVYFINPDNPEKMELLYRHGKVHILTASLSAYHRYLFEEAYRRAIEQNDDYTKIRVHTHHIDGNRHNNIIYNLLPVTEREHINIHRALRKGASTYDSLVAGLGKSLVDSIFGKDYFNDGDCSTYTASIHGVPYVQHMLNQISEANLPTDTASLRVKCLNGKFDTIDIANLNIFEILSALYAKRAITILT